MQGWLRELEFTADEHMVHSHEVSSIVVAVVVVVDLVVVVVAVVVVDSIHSKSC